MTSNDIFPLVDPLINRLEIIEVSSYIDEEKLKIAEEYLLPEVLKDHGLATNQIQFDDESLLEIIQGWCFYESGVRQLKRSLEKISRKYAKEVMMLPKPDQSQKLKFSNSNPDNLEKIKKYLGNPLFDPEFENIKNKKFAPGKTNILMVSGYIGSV